VIIHSHPFSHNKNNIPHQHSSTEEIVLFHTLSAIHAADGAIQILKIEGQKDFLLATIRSKEFTVLLNPTYGKTSPRAPPFA